MMMMTKEEAKDILRWWKNDTAYFEGVLKFDDMLDMLTNRMHFGEAEAHTILAALVLAGAKFQRSTEDEAE